MKKLTAFLLLSVVVATLFAVVSGVTAAPEWVFDNEDALDRMHGVDTEKYSNDTGYADVNSEEYYAPYITWSKENGILPAVSETAFEPEEGITRADMALAINNYIAVSGFNIKTFGYGGEFSDIASCTDAQKAAILNIQDNGIINGVGDKKFNPNGALTRAEAATVLTRLIKGVVGANYATRFDRSKFLIGAFEQYENAANKALMLVNCRNPYYAKTNTQTPINVTLTLTACKTVTAYENGYPKTYTADGNGKIVITIPTGEGMFVTVDNI